MNKSIDEQLYIKIRQLPHALQANMFAKKGSGDTAGCDGHRGFHAERRAAEELAKPKESCIKLEIAPEASDKADQVMEAPVMEPGAPFMGPGRPGMEPGAPFMGPGRPGMGPGTLMHGPEWKTGGHRGCPGKAPLSRERVLPILLEHEEGIRQKEIAREMHINPSSMSEFIDLLEKDCYIERKVDPADKRATLITLTEKGRARAWEIEDDRNERWSKMFENLTTEEKEELLRLLNKLILGKETREV